MRLGAKGNAMKFITMLNYNDIDIITMLCLLKKKSHCLGTKIINKSNISAT